MGLAGQVEGLLLGVQAVGGSLLVVGQEKPESPRTSQVINFSLGFWVLGETMARYCITAFSKDCSLAFPFPLRGKALKCGEVIRANNPLHGFEC